MKILLDLKFRTDVGQGTWPDVGVKDWIDENWKPKKDFLRTSQETLSTCSLILGYNGTATHPKDNQISMFYGIEQGNQTEERV